MGQYLGNAVTFLSFIFVGCNSSFEAVVATDTPKNGEQVFSGILSIENPESNSFSNLQSQSVNGECPKGSTVSISGDILNSPVQIKCDSAGSFSSSVQWQGRDGVKNVSVRVLNSLGIAPVSRSINLDRLEPSAPTIISPVVNASFSSSDQNLSGSCEASATLTLTGNVQGSPIEFACNGMSFSRTITLASGTGTKILTLTQQDRAGNNSSPRSLSVSLISAAPGPPTIISPAASALLVRASGVTVTGACVSGHTINITGHILSAPVVTSCSTGNFYSQAVNLTSGDGAKTISVSQTNGSATSTQTSISMSLDSTVPAAPTVSSHSSGATLTATIQTLSGSCESSAMVRITGSISASPIIVTCSDSMYSASVTFTNGNGAKSLTLTQTDRAGNTSSSRNINFNLNVPTGNPNWGPLNSVRVLFSGHSLIDNPLPDFVATTASQKSDNHAWNQQNIPGSPLRVRTQGDGGWGGYRLGKNRSSDGMNIISEVRNPQTIGAGQLYDTLVITERHDIISAIQWEETSRYLRHYHDLMISRNTGSRTFFYHSWWGLDKSNPAPWMTHERNAQVTWECVVSQVNNSVAAAGRSDRLRSLPAGAALVDLVERALNNQVTGISGTTLQKMNMIFRDDVHLTGLGAYYMSLVVYSAIYGKSPAGSAPESYLGISNSLASQLQTIAWNFVNAYYSQVSNPSARTMASCRSFTSNNTCHSWHVLRNESGSIASCSSYWGGSGADRPFGDFVITPFAPAW